MIIYVIYHDDDSYKIAHSTFSEYPWAKLCKIQSSKYCENAIFDYLQKNDSWDQQDFVGIITYSYSPKCSLPKLLNTVANINQYDNVDLIALRYVDQHIYEHHAGLPSHIISIMVKMGYDNINYDEIKPFYSNYWIAKPAVMKEYIKFFNKVRDLMEHDPVISITINGNSGYLKQVTEQQKIAFGYPWYTWHPFVLERMPCIFAYLHKLKIVLLTAQFD
jgi:hypothetical protein